jgi:hypothetical protein
MLGARGGGGLPLFASLIGEERGGWDLGQNGRNRGFEKLGIGRRVAVEPLSFDGIVLFDIFDADRVVLAAEGAAGVVALFLGRGDLAVKAAEEVNEFRVIIELSFGVVGAGEFLEEDLGEAGGGGLKTDFGKLRGVVAAQEIQEVILAEAILEDGLLFEAPFEIAAGGPVGDVSLGDGEIVVGEGGDDVLVGNGVPEHVVDHVALEFGEAGDAAIAADFARRD